MIGGQLKRYEIRRLDGDVWMDACSFCSDEQFKPNDARRVIEQRIADGEIRLLSRSGVFCLLQRFHNGRERRIGKDVVVGSNGLSVR